MKALKKEGHVVGSVLDSGHGVGNGVDRERVDAVVGGVDKMPARDVPMLNTNKDRKSTKPTTRTLQQIQGEHELTTAMTMAIKKWTKHHSHAGAIIAALANNDLTRLYAVGNSTSRNTVFLLTTL